MTTHEDAQAVDDSVSPTHRYLLQHYGPLLTLKHVAEVLHCTPNGLRMAMRRRRDPFGTALAGAGQRVGRRLFFQADHLAEIIDGDRRLPMRPDP